MSQHHSGTVQKCFDFKLLKKNFFRKKKVLLITISRVDLSFGKKNENCFQ